MRDSENRGQVHLFEAGIAYLEEAALPSAFTEAILLLGFNGLSFSSPSV